MAFHGPFAHEVTVVGAVAADGDFALLAVVEEAPAVEQFAVTGRSRCSCGGPVLRRCRAGRGGRGSRAVRSTAQVHLGSIDAANLRRAHALAESGTALGKIVLEGFGAEGD